MAVPVSINCIMFKAGFFLKASLSEKMIMVIIKAMKHKP